MTKRGSLGIGCLVFLLFRAATIPDYFTSIESDSIVLNAEKTQQGIERMAVAG